jgi:very-short-patch-repair endonuclease
MRPESERNISQTPSISKRLSSQTRFQRVTDERLVKILGVSELLPVSGTADGRIRAIAGRQRARAARRQLLAAGLTKHMVGSRLASGALVSAHDGVYIVGHVGPIPLGDETAALLAIGDDSYLSHLTAGVVYDIIVVPAGTPIHVTTPRARMHRPGIVVHRSQTLTPVDITVYEGLPITSVARTLLDLAEILSMRDIERAVDEALLRKLVTVAQIKDVIARSNGRRGAGILKRFVDWRTNNGASRTKWERMAANAFRTANFPPFEQNVRYLGFEHDFLWRKHMVTLEIDGWWHETRLNGERDVQKRALLRKTGFDPNQVTNTLVEENILEVVALMAGRLALHDPSRRQT